MSEANTAFESPPVLKKTNPLRQAWRQSTPGLAAIGFFSIFINILRLAAPIYILQILDKVVASGSLETLLMLTVITVVAIATGVCLEVVRRRMLMRWGSWIELTFGPKLFTDGLKPDNRHSVSENLRQLGTLRSFVSGQGLIAWMDLIWAPLFILVVFLISPPLSYVVLAGSVVALVFGILNERMSRDARNASLKSGREDRFWADAAERDGETIGSKTLSENLKNLWFRSASDRLDESIRSRSIHVYYAAAIRMTGRLVRIGVLGVGIWLVIEQTLTIGSVIAAHVLGRTAFSLVQGAMIRWRELVKSQNAYAYLRRSLKQADERQLSKAQNHSPVEMNLSNASYRYPNQARSVFRNVNLTLKPGEVLCVIGDSASGKSTFSRLSSGMLAPRSGSIRLGDNDVSRLQHESFNSQIGYMPEKTVIFKGTVRDNIAGMTEGDMNLVTQAAKQAGIHEAILSLPRGYDTVISEDEPLLSAGQRKSVAVARAFYGSPSLIVMDEPLPHLDSETQKSILSAIGTMKSKGTISILTTLRNTLARFADKVLLLHESGNVVLETRDQINELLTFHGGPSKEDVAAIRKASRRRKRNLRSV